MKFWKLLNRWNEDIPDTMTSGFENLYRMVTKEIKNFAFYQEIFEKVGLTMIELFLFSTYDNQIRIRSCYVFTIIHQLLISQINDNFELYLIEKKGLAKYFISLLRDHFKTIWKDWSLESTPILNEIFNSFTDTQIHNEISYMSDVNKLDYMTNCCTHAMILNLVSRLIQESHSNDPKIEDGIALMFNDWRSIYEYNRYVAEIFIKMNLRKLIDDEIKTLDYDTIENGITLLKKAVTNHIQMQVDFNQLKEISLLLLENYLDHHLSQLNFILQQLIVL